MTNNIKKIAFEKAIEQHLLNKGGYIRGIGNTLIASWHGF